MLQSKGAKVLSNESFSDYMITTYKRAILYFQTGFPDLTHLNAWLYRSWTQID